MAEKEKFDNIDGLRSIAAIMIILMHVMANLSYTLPSNPLTKVISVSGNFVQLFFIVSGFGLCCGYYERIKNNQISLNKFYNKRYLKILPYFALLVVLDVCITLILNGGGTLIVWYKLSVI